MKLQLNCYKVPKNCVQDCLKTFLMFRTFLLMVKFPQKELQFYSKKKLLKKKQLTNIKSFLKTLFKLSNKCVRWLLQNIWSSFATGCLYIGFKGLKTSSKSQKTKILNFEVNRNNFGPLLPKGYFWKGDFRLDSVFTKSWDWSYMFYIPKMLSLSRSATH